MRNIGFLSVFDQSLTVVVNSISMPDHRSSLLVRLIMQNHGVLSKTKRWKELPLLTGEEISSVEAEILSIMRDGQA